MTVHDQVMNGMREMAALFSSVNISLEMPPQSNLTLGTTYVDIDFGKMLTARFKFDSRFMNPIGTFHGGFLSAAFDDTFGPLSYMAASRPVVTLELSTTFIRPFTAKDEYIDIRAELVSKSKSLLVMRAEAKTKEGKLIATSTTHSLILSDEQLNAASK